MSTATLSSKFQISVLKEVREALGLKPGQKLAFINTGTGIRLVPQPTMAELVGVMRGANTQGVRDRDDRALAPMAAKPGSGEPGSARPAPSRPRRKPARP